MHENKQYVPTSKQRSAAYPCENNSSKLPPVQYSKTGMGGQLRMHLIEPDCYPNLNTHPSLHLQLCVG